MKKTETQIDRTRRMAKIDMATDAALDYFKTVMKKESTIVGVSKTEEGWKVALEVVDYRGSGFDPTLGLYEVQVDHDLNIESYRRTHLRRTSQLTWSSIAAE